MIAYKYTLDDLPAPPQPDGFPSVYLDVSDYLKELHTSKEFQGAKYFDDWTEWCIFNFVQSYQIIKKKFKLTPQEIGDYFFGISIEMSNDYRIPGIMARSYCLTKSSTKHDVKWQPIVIDEFCKWFFDCSLYPSFNAFKASVCYRIEKDTGKDISGRDDVRQFVQNNLKLKYSLSIINSKL